MAGGAREAGKEGVEKAWVDEVEGEKREGREAEEGGEWEVRAGGKVDGEGGEGLGDVVGEGGEGV